MNLYDRHMLSTFRGAPPMPLTAGSLLTVLDAFLLTGYGHVTAQTAVIASGVCTATVNAGENFEVAAIIQISGAAPADLNAQARVLAKTPTTVSWATTLPDGPVTGPIGLRYAPVPGWEKAFSKTNVAVYRSTHPESTGMYLRIDDTDPKYPQVRGYKSMTDVDTGLDQFPSAAELTGIGRWVKNPNYLLHGDRGFFLFCSDVYGNGAYTVRGFGDLLTLSNQGDAWGCYLSSCWAEVDAYGQFLSNDVSNWGKMHVCRSFNGQKPSPACVARAFVSGSQIASSGADGYLGAVADALNGKLMLSEVCVRAVGSSLPRAVVPAIRHIPQSAYPRPANASNLVELEQGGLAIALPIPGGTALIELGRGRP